VTPEQCRIVKYDEYYDYIERSFDGEEVSYLIYSFHWIESMDINDVYGRRQHIYHSVFSFVIITVIIIIGIIIINGKLTKYKKKIQIKAMC